jgi:hypothetical protein
VARDVSLEARELTQRGLEDYACGRLREAVFAWEKAVHLAPHDPQANRLLAFARKRVRERDTRPVAHARPDTLESPIPGFLASLTAPESGERPMDSSQEKSADEEWAQVDTRRVLAATGERVALGAVQDEQDAADTWKDLPVQQGDKLQDSARGFVDECQAALKEGRDESAGLAAELALQLSEQARSHDVDSIVDSGRPLFERAFRACIGDMRCSPIRAIRSEELAKHGFDHRAAFLMSRMDGMLSVSDLLDIAGMPRFDALRLMAALRRAQAVDMVPAG